MIANRMYQHNLHRYDIIDAIMTAFSIKWHIPNQDRKVKVINYPFFLAKLHSYSCRIETFWYSLCVLNRSFCDSLTSYEVLLRSNYFRVTEECYALRKIHILSPKTFFQKVPHYRTSSKLFGSGCKNNLPNFK